MNGRRSILAAVALVTLVTSGCGQLRGEREFVDATGRVYEPVSFDQRVPVVPGATGPAVVEVAPDAALPAAFAFSTTLLDGAAVTGADLVGESGTMLTFLQPTCPISTEEAPKIAAAAQRHPDLRFVIAFSGGDADSYAEMIAAAGLDLPNVTTVDDTSLAMWNRFAVTASPSSIFVDDELRVRSSYGALGDDGLDRAAGIIADGFDPSI